MAKWQFQNQTRRFEGPAPGGRDVSHGENVYVQGPGGEKRKVAVWFASNAETDLKARDAVRPYLDDDAPPEHLLVTSTGVTIIEETS